MLIDADCHISSHRFDGLAMTADDLIEQMDRNGVDRSLVWLKPPYDKNIEPENRAIYEAARKYPARLLPFGWANPHLGKETTHATIKQCFEEYGFHGIKFNGAQDGYVIDDDKFAMPFIEEAAKYGKIIAFHIGADFYENTHPYRLGRIAGLFPEIQFILIHLGGTTTPALDRSAIEVMQQHANITAIGSNVGEFAIMQAIARVGADRICFGSDTPFRWQHVILAMYRAMMRDLSEDDQAKVFGGNLARLLSLSD
jgi:predicted TIM-barrel fold metal-dependent hydrolase